MTESINGVRVSLEPRRGCGYRQEGGLYLVGPALVECDSLPVELEVCPTCGSGVHPSRGWTWVQAPELLGDGVRYCDHGACPFSHIARAGLLWIGEEFYPFPTHFRLEARDLGISRRIPQVPRDFKLGETWVLLAHRRAVNVAHIRDAGRTAGPGIFGAFLPTEVELVVTDDQARDAKAMQKLRDRGIEPVMVEPR